MVSLQDISIKIKKPEGRNPLLGIILGSGLGNYAGTLDDPITIDIADIEGYPGSSVQGHAGKLVFGKIPLQDGEKKDILVFQGRIHLYESGDVTKTLIPIILAHQLGVRRLIITNAAGGMNPLFSAGDLMVIHDFINTTYENPLRGLGVNYHKNNLFNTVLLSDFLIDKTRSIASEVGIPLRVGTYCWVKGPSYETVSEIQMLRRMGGDAVGMSTIPEIIVAHHLGIDCVAISCITNMSTGLSSVPLTHHEVTATAQGVQENFSRLISALAREMA
jgi:purine-nucleoside phosphorylase